MDASPDARRINLEPSDLLLLLALGLATTALCVPGLMLLSFIWQRSTFYGHGFAIPVVAAYLVWSNRDDIAAAWERGTPPLAGSVVALGAAAFLSAAIFGDAGFLAGLGVPLVLGTAAYGIRGLPMLRASAVPLAFLVLMVPPPRFLTYQILFRLKVFVTDLAIGLLQSLGATVAAEGNVILLPGHELFVADACSGLTSIITLLPLSAIVAYFLSHGVWRRVVVIGSVVPLAIAANVLRVTVTVLLVSDYGIEMAQGLLHEGFGLWTYLVGTIALIGVAKVLR
jgi:exosortase